MISKIKNEEERVDAVLEENFSQIKNIKYFVEKTNTLEMKMNDMIASHTSLRFYVTEQDKMGGKEGSKRKLNVGGKSA
jgi:hypothetical protein